MAKIRRILPPLAALVALVAGAAIMWRRNPRIGTRFMNTVVDPGMIRRGLAGGPSSEIGMLEHVGRRSQVRRLTLVHPEPTPDGFRIMVPLGRDSQWARNVLAAGHCRLQLHGLVYELDEPSMVPVSMVEGLPPVVKHVEGLLGFKYLLLRRFGVAPGTLEVGAIESTARPGDVSAVTERAPAEAAVASTATGSPDPG